MEIIEKIKNIIEGDVDVSNETLTKYSHDASIFEVRPEIVVYPKSSKDIQALVRFVQEHKPGMAKLSLTMRAAGTCMSGGSINESIIVDTSRYMNKIISVENDYAVVEPGCFYRDFEKATLEKGLIMPTYPASKELCAVGGMVGNNAGGEKSISYGKVENWVKELKVVFRDGYEYTIKPITKKELLQKITEQTLEGGIYKELYKIITENSSLIKAGKPQVSKNSAGYYLWNIYDEKTETFDLCKLIVGSQGTLGVVTQITFGLIPVAKESRLVVLFLPDIKRLGELVDVVLPFKPESIESYDDYSLKLAIRFFPDFMKSMTFPNFIKLGLSFIPEGIMLLRHGLPKLVMIVECVGSDSLELDEKVNNLIKSVEPFQYKMRLAKTKEQAEKYWRIRRESFNMLRKHIKGKHTAPFIDDICVKPEYLPEFLPKITAILDEYKFIYTIAGHAGNGNFHIIPLMDFSDKNTKDIILEVSDRVYDLVLSYQGTITAEHNDGIVRTPYLEQMYGKEIYSLFVQTKKLFDPLNIFNPGKKVALLDGQGGTKEYLANHLILEKHDKTHNS